MLIGIISDTHGLLRPEAVAALHGVDLIIHAGDVGKPDVLQGLGEVAPVYAVRGNVDTQPWAAKLPETIVVKTGGLSFFVLHDIARLAADPVGAGFEAVVFGHSHKPSIVTKDGIVYINPGAAGPRRFRLPVSIARVQVSGLNVEPRIIELNV